MNFSFGKYKYQTIFYNLLKEFLSRIESGLSNTFSELLFPISISSSIISEDVLSNPLICMEWKSDQIKSCELHKYQGHKFSQFQQ